MRRILWIVAALLAVFIFVCGCSANEETPAEPEETQPIEDTSSISTENFRETMLYYQNSDGFIVPVMRQIQWQEGIGKAALSYLVGNVGNEADAARLGLKTIIPDGTDISISIEDSVATVALSKEANGISGALQEANMITGIVNTLCEFETVNSVKFMVEGCEDGKLANGTDISSEFMKQDMNVESLSSDVMEASAKVELYFESEYEDLLIPVTRYIDEKPNLEEAINQLLSGPKMGFGLGSSIPEGTKLKSVRIESDGYAVMDFTKEFSELEKNPKGEKKVLKSLLATAQKFEGVEDIIVMVEGREYKPADEETLAVPVFVNQFS